MSNIDSISTFMKFTSRVRFVKSLESNILIVVIGSTIARIDIDNRMFSLSLSLLSLSLYVNFK